MSKNSRVLVVDDLPDWRKTLSGLLAEEGYEVRSVASRKEALEALSNKRFHVAVLDVRLDEADEDNREGLLLMHQIRERDPSVAVIILTGYADVEMVREALEPNPAGDSPAFGFLEKTEVSQLLDYVKRALSKRKLPAFEPSQECELTISLEPGQRVLVRGRGSIRFTYTSRNVLDLDPARLMRWASERLIASTDRRFILKEVGKQLYDALLEQQASVLSGYQRALGRVAKRQYLHLVFETRRELMGLPLEFLFSEESSEYLALLHPVIRQIRDVVTRRDPVSAELINSLVSAGEKLRVLLLVSNTEPPIALIDDIGEELANLLSQVDWLDLTLVPTGACTYQHVRALLQNARYHIVHYVGHGHFRQDSSEQSSLFFWEGPDRSGRVLPMNGNELRWYLENSDTRLFHLTCCEGTKAGTAVDLLDDDYLGIADAIIHAGVPAVLGYRWPVPAKGAQTMTLAFYNSFLRHGSPELALLDARRAVAAGNKDDLTWVSPILIIQS